MKSAIFTSYMQRKSNPPNWQVIKWISLQTKYFRTGSVSPLTFQGKQFVHTIRGAHHPQRSPHHLARSAHWRCCEQTVHDCFAWNPCWAACLSTPHQPLEVSYNISLSLSLKLHGAPGAFASKQRNPNPSKWRMGRQNLLEPFALTLGYHELMVEHHQLQELEAEKLGVAKSSAEPRAK